MYIAIVNNIVCITYPFNLENLNSEIISDIVFSFVFCCSSVCNF